MSNQLSNTSVTQETHKVASKRGGKSKPIVLERRYSGDCSYIITNMPHWLKWKTFKRYKNISSAEYAIRLKRRDEFYPYEFRIINTHA